MAEEMASRPRDERFERQMSRMAPERMRCGHCGQVFDPSTSSVGDHGICRECFED